MELASMLQLPKINCHIPVGGLNDITTISKCIVTATIKSRLNEYHKTLDFLVVPNITSVTPNQQINRKRCNLPSNLQLADPEFHKPAQVQLLLGAGTTLAALCVGQIVLSSPKEPDLILQKTRLGWVIGGNLSLYDNQRHVAKCHLENVQEDICKFWELEEISSIRHLSKEETECEAQFQKTVARADDGRYIVALPFNNKKNQLGESRHMALKRLQALERRFNRNPDLQIKYRNVMNEYLSLGYMTKINDQSGQGFYLPHQAVFKENSLTTKVRVVFDASAASSTGISLNDSLLAGPTIQDDIFSLLLRFRLHNYVLTGDIEKMYLQIRIRDNDQSYLRILWKEEDGSCSTFQFNRLIFGLKPASFLATRCLHQLADDEQHCYPRASITLKRDLYVDDLLTGANTIDEIIQLRKEMNDLLKSGGFNLRQCASNASEVLDTIPDSNVNLLLKNNNDLTLKTLGIHWNSDQDAIIYTVKMPTNNRVTKRIIFSEIAKIFDPLGLLNPVVVTAKLLMQELWRFRLDWDESLPIELHTKWENFATQLPGLNDISFSRKMMLDQYDDLQLHGFCDASEKAYGACIYLRTINTSGDVMIQLYCAKSRVAPIKIVQTIPRLELCAAALLTNLYHSVKSSIDININRTFFWSDSMIALHWINTSPCVLKTFVSHKVSEIQTYTKMEDWNYVNTHENPADLLSRGLLPNDFKSASLWTKGPRWLSEKEQTWPSQPLIKPKELPEMRKSTCLIISSFDDDILLRYPSYTRLQRIVVWCLRFRRSHRRKGLITVDELETASIRILLLVQRRDFASEHKALINGQRLSTKSKLLPLNPFIDKDGLIRVGGRLHQSTCSYQQKHPILLPKSHHVTQMLIKREHVNNMHGGIQTTLYSMRQKYWPIDGRNQVRKVVRNCVRCVRAKPPPVNYTMGTLPRVRTIATRPFTNVGIDYCGPFFIKEKRFRNRNKIKDYVSIFICLSTKAVHLEVVSDLTTEAFIAALKRFISRRGKCSFIQSDNGTNFVGANNELRDIVSLLKSQTHNEEVHNYLASQSIVWRFNPPGSPHFGGIWEAAVKSFKHHLRRVVGMELFTFEQFNTLVVEIEAVLNSRPLTPLSSDPNDLNALTPSHFLIGDLLSSLPEQDLSDTLSNRLSMWQHIQKVKQDFWSRWHKEYVNELNIRHHWTKGDHSIKKNTIVVLRDENLYPLQWRLGRVTEVFPGQDGIIRTVRLKTATGEITRAVKRLAPLPVDSEPATVIAE